MARTIKSLFSTSAFRSSSCSSTICLARTLVNGFNPSITIVCESCSSCSTSQATVRKFQLGAITCSMSNEAVMAFRKSFTATFTSACSASGIAIMFTKRAVSFPSQSRVQRPMIWITSVNDPRTPIVRHISHHCQSNPSLAVPKAMMMSISSFRFIRCR